MKFQLTLFLFLVLSFSVHGQSFFRLIDKNSGAFLKAYDAEIIQDGYINFASLSDTQTEVLSIARPYSESRISGEHSYYLSIERRDYMPFWLEIDYFSKDTLDVFLERDPNFKEEEKDLYFDWCGVPIMSDYYPKPFRSWDYLPDEIEGKIKVNLIRRIGEKAFEKLYISTAHEFDTDLMNRLGVRNSYPSGSKSYRICLSFSDPEKGISQFTTEVVYLDNGTQIVAPKLPHFYGFREDDFSNWNFLDLEEIKKSVLNEFADQSNLSNAKFEYYPRTDTFSWVFEKDLGKDEKGWNKIRSIQVDAFTGELLAVFYDKEMIIVD
ncbi:hypothetical protein [Algoriphagus taiwanensis]|uniref:PepSY domain-containing protein n=1 Tax=Algoriphagus taiwanensis TaxID=1445656 RepID=A0ABQ6PWZ7_9BACT|nr:hypothetical protein Ataiwa_07510 [Algoriphagus taiwanensis]